MSLRVLLLLILAACTRPAELAVRPFSPVVAGKWIGNGIGYGPHRDGQRPGGRDPTREQLREDLLLMAPRWGVLRMYDAAAPLEGVLELIRAESIPMKVVLGIWIAPETTPAARAANRAQVENGIRLANAYPDAVLAIDVGNETQVSWSDHRVPAELLIGYLREVRRRTKAPVGTADDFAFWEAKESDAVAREVDFLDVHVYAMWAGKQLEEALPFTQEKLAAVGKAHPGRALVLGEFGWATRRHSEGEQSRLIKGAPGEAQQKAFYEQAIAWTTREQIANLYFEAFDENWKGGAHPDEVEKHWGLFRADRTPKLALGGGR